MKLSEQIMFAREKAGLTQAELANKIGVTQQAIQQLESGRTKSPRISTLIRMAQALNQAPNWLVNNVGTLSSLESATLSKDEYSLLESFSKLNTAEKKIVVRMVRALVIDK